MPGTVSKLLLVILRVGEFICGAVVLGLLGRVFHLIDDAPGVLDPNGRLIYAAVLAGLTILDSLIFIFPAAYAFWSWPLDSMLFVAWIVAFGLLESYLVSPPGIDVNWTGCSAWRTVLAFSFIAGMIYLVSGFLGVYWTFEYGKAKSRGLHFTHRHKNRVLNRNRAAADGPMAQTTNGTDGNHAMPVAPKPHNAAHPTTTVTPAVRTPQSHTAEIVDLTTRV
ncbi:hypothetical protein QBC35DRAFT_531342 [Podospora australis]|uniref:MARVEL domain-containing protein n=1 Tax=Podospora australis TaxID=1536484 RepID=A0AAN7AK30_9PEZI|nr:hypothetical protein QBC35DRAFT_531342 [Podospora australis]